MSRPAGNAGIKRKRFADRSKISVHPTVALWPYCTTTPSQSSHSRELCSRVSSTYFAGSTGPPRPSMSDAGPSTAHILTSLPISHPSFIPLLNHTPLTLLDAKSRDKLLSRINVAVIGRDESDKRAGWRAAKTILEKHDDIIVTVTWGKSWVTSTLGALSLASLTGDRDQPLGSLVPALMLLSRLIGVSSRYPSFEREVIQPVMGKVALTLVRLLERAVVERESSFMVSPSQFQL